MKYALTFATLAAIISYCAISQGGWWYLLLWFAISFFTLSAGHAVLGPAIFGKQPDGTIPVWVKMVHFPFFLYSAVIWQITRILSRENPYDKVEKDLIIGRRLRAHELPDGIVNCVDLTSEFEDPKSIRESTNYVNLPILDAGVPSPEGLISMLSQLREGATYIHCAQGHGRTGLITLALLSARGRIRSFEEGFALLKQVRPGVGLNKTQVSFIRKFVSEQCAKGKTDTPHR